VIVGLTVFVLDFVIFNFLFHVLGFQTKFVLGKLNGDLEIALSLPNIISVGIATVFGYICNRTWSFESDSDNVASQFGKYVAVALFNNALNNLIFAFLLYNIFAKTTLDMRLVTTICKVLATSFQVVSSYLLYKYVVFRKEKEVVSEAIVP
jgi:putative flippase GtrA